MTWTLCGVLLISVVTFVDDIMMNTTKTAPSKATLGCLRSRSQSRSAVILNHENPAVACITRLLDGLLSFGLDADAT